MDLVFFAVNNRVEGQKSPMALAPAYGTAERGPRIARTPVTTEAFFLLADHALTTLGYRRWQWRCNAANAPSRRAAERFGFTYEGTFRNHMVVKGANRDTAWFSITSAEWPPIRARFQAWLAPENFTPEGHQRTPLTPTP